MSSFFSAVTLENGRNMPVQNSHIKTVERNASTTGGEKRKEEENEVQCTALLTKMEEENKVQCTALLTKMEEENKVQCTALLKKNGGRE